MADYHYLARKATTGEHKRCYKCDRTGHLAVECKVVSDGFGRNAVENNRSVQSVRQGNSIVRAPRNETWNTRLEGSTRTAPRSQTYKQDELDCYKCSRLGHIAINCTNGTNAPRDTFTRSYFANHKKQGI